MFLIEIIRLLLLNKKYSFYNHKYLKMSEKIVFRLISFLGFNRIEVLKTSTLKELKSEVLFSLIVLNYLFLDFEDAGSKRS